MTIDTANVVKVKRRAVNAQAIQFTGKNGSAVAALIKENGGTARNGGSYVSASTDDGRIFRLRKGDWIVIDADGSVNRYLEDSFSKFFLIKE